MFNVLNRMFFALLGEMVKFVSLLNIFFYIFY